MTSEERGQSEQTEDLNYLDGGEEAGQDDTSEVVVKSFEDVLFPEGVLITISCIMGILLLLFIIVCSLWCHYRRLQLHEEARVIKAGVTRRSLDDISTAATPCCKDINICVQDPELSDDVLFLQSQIQRGSTAHRGTHRQSEIQMGLHDHRGTHRQSDIQMGLHDHRGTHRQSEIQMGLHDHRGTQRQSEIQMGLHDHRGTRRQSEIQMGLHDHRGTQRQSEIQMGLHDHRGTQRQSEIQMGLHDHRGTQRQSEIQMGLHDHRGTRRQSEVQPFTNQHRASSRSSRAESVSPTNPRRPSIVYSPSDSSLVNILENPRRHSSLKEPYMNYEVNSNNSPCRHSPGVSRNKGSPQEYLSTPETPKHDKSRKFSLDSPVIVTKETGWGSQLPSQHSNVHKAREHIGSKQLRASPLQHVDNANSMKHIDFVKRQKSPSDYSGLQKRGATESVMCIAEQPDHLNYQKYSDAGVQPAMSENKTASHDKPMESRRESFDEGLVMKKEVSHMSFQNKNSSEPDHRIVVKALRDYWKRKDMAEMQARSPKEGSSAKLFTTRSKTCCPESCRGWTDNSATRRQLRFQRASSVPSACKCPISRDMSRCSSPKSCRCLTDKSTANSLQKASSTVTPDCQKCCECSSLSSKSPTVRVKITTTDRPCTCTICENESQRRSPQFNRRLINESPTQLNSNDSPSPHRLPSKSCSSVSSPRYIHISQKMDTTYTSSMSQNISQSSEASECVVDSSPTRRVSSLLRAFTVLTDAPERYSPEFRHRRRKFHKP